MVEVPAVVRSKAAVAGAGAWLAGLDDLVADLARRWSLTVGPDLGGGTEAVVLEVARADATPAVLKLLVPRGDDVAAHEIAVLRHTDGSGCARLLEADEARGALLLERLGPSMHDLGTLSYLERLDVLTDLCAALWRPVAGRSLPPLPTGAEKATRLVEHVGRTWEALGRPCPEAVVAHALDCAERRRAAHDDARSVLVHGDVHQWNALRRGDGWALVDPDGLFAEPAYDLGVLLREDPGELLDAGPWTIARRLADRSGVDPVAAWEWGVVERVSTGLLCEQIGLEPVGREMLRVASTLAPGAPGSPEVRVRPAAAEDRPFLERMLAVAADWRPGTAARPVEQVLAEPALAHYVDGWLRAGDVGVVAQDRGGEPLGAAWARRFATADAGYGFVAEDVPEVSVGVVATARGLGIGRRLLVAVADAARAAGIDRLSLSVETANPAMHLYRSLGWAVVAEAPGSATMLLELR